MKLLSQLDSAANIKQDANNRFVTDAKIAEWNDKWNFSESEIKAVKVNKAADADTVGGFNVNQNLRKTDTVQFGKIGVGTSSPSESIHTTNKVKADKGFVIGNFLIEYNASENALDFSILG